jgi:integrase
MLKLVHRHGSKHWYMRGTVKGQYIDESTGFSDREAAETIRIKREYQLSREAIYGRAATATFADAALSYIENGGERRFMAPLLRYFGEAKLADIDQIAVEKAARSLFPTASSSTVNRQAFTPVSAVLRHAAQRGMRDPISLRRPRQPSGRIRWLNPQEADKLITACSPHMRPLVIFLHYTGARLSEASYLDSRSVDLDRAHVSFTATKNGEPRGVPLHPRVVAGLSDLNDREGTVFRRADGRPYKKRAGGGGQVKTGFKGACRRAKIEDFSPHDCRHTWATWHYKANRDLGALMRLGGWKSERMVLRYAHVDVGELKTTINALPWGKSGKPRIEDTKHTAKTKG